MTNDKHVPTDQAAPERVWVSEGSGFEGQDILIAESSSDPYEDGSFSGVEYIRIDAAVERAKLEGLAGFTPGPWKAWQPRGDESVPVRTNGLGITIAYVHQGAITNAIANAALIAAAPDLLALTHSLLDAIDAERARAEKAEAERDEAYERFVFWRDEADKRAAERDEARSATKAAYERAAQVVDTCNAEGPYQAIGAATRIRALATEAETTALAEMLDAETRACIATVRKRIDDYVRECGSYDPSTGVTEFPGNGEEWISDMEEIEDDLTARLDQRKEGGA